MPQSCLALRLGIAVQSFDPALVRLAYGFALHFGARREDAEDIAQEALLKLVTHAEPVEEPPVWLFVVIRRLSGCARRRAEPLPETPASFDPWRAVDLDIDMRRLLERIPLRGRRSFLLSLEGYTERESAARLGCSVKATEKALHQARREVRRRLTSR